MLSRASPEFFLIARADEFWAPLCHILRGLPFGGIWGCYQVGAKYQQIYPQIGSTFFSWIFWSVIFDLNLSDFYVSQYFQILGEGYCLSGLSQTLTVTDSLNQNLFLRLLKFRNTRCCIFMWGYMKSNTLRSSRNIASIPGKYHLSYPLSYSSLVTCYNNTHPYENLQG